MLAPDVIALCASLGALAATAGGMFWWSRARVTERRLARLPITPIGEARTGRLVKIVGRVRYGERRLSGPVTGRTCACWDAVIEGQAVSVDGAMRRTVASVARATDFLLEDGTGRARVEMDHGSLMLVRDAQVAIHGLEVEERERVLSYLGAPGSVETEPLWCSEAVVEEGESVLACGVARWEADPSGASGYREMARRLVVTAPGRASVIVSDDPTWGRDQPRRELRKVASGDDD